MQKIWRTAAQVCSSIDTDGGVLLDVNLGLCHSLNPVGARIWSMFEKEETGLQIDQIIDVLALEFSVSRQRLVTDVSDFIGELEAKGAIKAVSSSESPADESSKRVPRASAAHITSLLSHKSTSDSVQILNASPSGTKLGARMNVADVVNFVLAILALIAADLTLKLGGFRVLHAAVVRFPKRSKGVLDPAIVARVCSIVDRAAACYFKHAWCLQRSAVAVCLLRLWGARAELVIGCRRIPFAAHAWAEVGDKVVNDDRRIRKIYTVLLRC